jgi:hypothetical protein
LLISDEGGIAGSWVQPWIWGPNLLAVATTGNGYLYFGRPDIGLFYVTGYVEGSPVDPGDLVYKQMFTDWIFPKLLLTDTHIFAVSHDEGILRLELASDGAPKLEDPLWFLVGKRVSDLANGAYGKLLFASTYESGIFRSQDSGDTWASKSIGLPEGAQFEDPQIGYMPQIPAVIATHTGLLFASVAGVGVFVSGDNAESWQPLGKFDLAQPVVEALAFVKGGSLIAGTTNGIYTYPKNCISAPAEPAKSPRRENRR